MFDIFASFAFFDDETLIFYVIICSAVEALLDIFVAKKFFAQMNFFVSN